MQLTDMLGARYDIFSGQVMSGAGTSREPSLEISDLTGNSLGNLDAFVERCNSEFVGLEMNLSAFLEAMIPVERRDEFIAEEKPTSSKSVYDNSQPYVIEFSPDPPLVLPRYGSASRLTDEYGHLF